MTPGSYILIASGTSSRGWSLAVLCVVAYGCHTIWARDTDAFSFVSIHTSVSSIASTTVIQTPIGEGGTFLREGGLFQFVSLIIMPAVCK